MSIAKWCRAVLTDDHTATLFKEIGFDQPTAVGLIVSGTNFIFTLFALKYIDIIGRRRIMLWSAPGMVVGLVLASIAFHCKYPSIPHHNLPASKPTN